MKRGSPRRSRGFFIIEILVTLGLLVFVFAAAGQLLRVTVLTTAASEHAADQASRLDNLISAMRRDVWQASDIHITDLHGVELTIADNQKIIWRTDPDNSVQRTDPSGRSTRWVGVGMQLQFIRDRATLIVAHPGPPENQQISLVSQVILGRAQ